jgi:hypothetical protein
MVPTILKKTGEIFSHYHVRQYRNLWAWSDGQYVDSSGSYEGWIEYDSATPGYNYTGPLGEGPLSDEQYFEYEQTTNTAVYDEELSTATTVLLRSDLVLVDLSGCVGQFDITLPAGAQLHDAVGYIT